MRDDGFEYLLHDTAAAAECASVDAWWPRQVALYARHPSPIASAIAGGFAADRLAWARPWTERTFAALLALAAIARLDASSPATHIALAGALATGAVLVGEADACWEAAGGDPAGVRWRRDRALLSVASSARAQRLERAWARLRGSPATRPD